MKRVLMVVLALIIALVPLSGCKGNEDEYSLISVWVEEEGNPGEIVNNDSEDSDTSSKKDTTSSKKDTTTSKKDTTSSKKDTTTSSKKDTTTSSKKDTTTSNVVSTTPNKDGKYDFKGKTYWMAITDEPQYHSTTFSAKISSFENKYNMKFKTTQLVFNEYNKQVRQKMSTGTSYDICYIHGSMFPGCALNGALYNDLSQTVKQVKTTTVNEQRSKDLFMWDDKLYGVTSNQSAYAHIIYYNKVKFANADLEDPREIYENNPADWTWDKIHEMGRKVAKDGEVFFAHQNEVINLYGVNGYELKNGKIYNNMRSPLIRKGLDHMARIYTGNDAIGSMETKSQNYVDGFANGKFYIMIEEHAKYTAMTEAAMKSSLFGAKDQRKANVGIVPIPLPAENTEKKYPTGWYTAVASGQGSDPTLAVLWADHFWGYKSVVNDKYALSKEDQALVDKLLSGNTIPVRHGNVSNDKTDINQSYADIVRAAKNGLDITQAIEQYYPVMNDCVITAIGKDRLVEPY